MLRDRVSTALIVAVVLALVISPIAGLVEPAAAGGGNDIKTYAATEDVSVWERAPLPFRLDTDDAAKSVQNGGLDVEYKPDSTGPVSARKGKMAVYSTGTTIDASFDTVTGAGTDPLAGKDTTLVVARMEPSQDGTDSREALPTSLGEVQDFFDTEDANQNASFRTVDTGKIADDGSLDTSLTFDQSGAYALFLTTGDAVSADEEGNISINGDTTIVGMDAAVVEEEPADVTDKPSSVVDGTTASFTVDTPTSEKTNLSVVLYDTSKWTGSYTLVSIEEEVNENLSAENITIEHSIAEVNGEAELADSYSMFGVDVGPASQAGSFSAGSIIQFLTEEADDSTDSSVTEPNTIATDDTVMDASMVTKVNQTGSVTVDLQTYENWSTGEYTWIVVTGGNDAGDIQTETGILDVKESSDEDDGDDGQNDDDTRDDTGDDDRDDDDSDDDDTGVTDPETPSTDPPENITGVAANSSVTTDGGTTQIKITGTSPGSPVTVDLPVNETEIERTGVGLTQMRFNTTMDTAANMTVTSQATGTDQVSSTFDLGYIQINEDVNPDSVSDATYTFTITQQRLDERGVAPEDVALFRKEAGGWNELDTTLVSSTGTRYTFEAESPGLSLYAISKKGAAQASMEVTDATVEPTSVTIDESVEVTATIENTGNAQGTFDAVLQVDGDDVTTQSVTVNAGETTTVTFEHTFDATGDHTVAVSGTDAGTVEVTSGDSDTTTTTTTTTTTPPADDDDGGSNLPLYLGITAVIVGAVVVFIYLYNEGYFEQ